MSGWYADWMGRCSAIVANGLPARIRGMELLPPWNGGRLLALIVDIDELYLPRSHRDRGFELHISLLFEDELTDELAVAALRLHQRWAGQDVLLRVVRVGSGGGAMFSPTDPIASDVDARRLHSAGSYARRDMHISL